MQNQESIYKWIPKVIEKPKKEKLYRSHHNPTIPPTGSTLWYFNIFIVPMEQQDYLVQH